jgi:hypothetical protein
MHDALMMHSVLSTQISEALVVWATKKRVFALYGVIDGYCKRGPPHRTKHQTPTHQTLRKMTPNALHIYTEQRGTTRRLHDSNIYF